MELWQFGPDKFWAIALNDTKVWIQQTYTSNIWELLRGQEIHKLENWAYN